jgi:hypothetical protein
LEGSAKPTRDPKGAEGNNATKCSRLRNTWIKIAKILGSVAMCAGAVYVEGGANMITNMLCNFAATLAWTLVAGGGHTSDRSF